MVTMVTSMIVLEPEPQSTPQTLSGWCNYGYRIIVTVVTMVTLHGNHGYYVVTRNYGYLHNLSKALSTVNATDTVWLGAVVEGK